MDVALWDLVALPLIPIGSMCWDDLVLPGTDLEFLGRPPFVRCRVVVSISGALRCWEISGAVLRRGGELDGIVDQLAEPPRDS